MKPVIFLQKAIHKVYKIARDAINRVYDLIFPSYYQSSSKNNRVESVNITIQNLQSNQLLRKSLIESVRDIFAHRFNLLGSGCFNSVHPKEPAPIVNKANKKYATSVAAQISSDYKPIDWHQDPKSGFRWSPTEWHRDIKYGREGEDIILPWELSRMQHLPQLALAWTQAEIRCAFSEDSSETDPFILEFQNEIYDFIAHNPPRWGVNWYSPMDVAIRATNWLIAYDIFHSNGHTFPNEFEEVFQSSLMDHGRYIWFHPEWDPILRTNHYLSDLAGLIFISLHLQPSSRTNRWLKFAARELIANILYQFHPDGSNFEASTCYHMLSTEIIVDSLAAIFSLSKDRKKNLQKKLFQEIDKGLVPDIIYQRLKAIHRYLTDIVYTNGETIQIGDNDNGYFIKLLPERVVKSLFPETERNHLYIEKQLSVLIDNLNSWNQKPYPNLRNGPLDTILNAGLEGISGKQSEIIHSQGWSSYPGTGLYIYHDENYHLIIRCGSIGQGGIGGHSHNDQLSITLSYNGTPFIVDPGTNVYSSDSQARMTFRSTAMHNTLCIEGYEQNTISPPEKMLFAMGNLSHANGKFNEDGHFIGRHSGYPSPHIRKIIPNPNGPIFIWDILMLETSKNIHFHLNPDTEKIVEVSPNEWEIALGNDHIRIGSTSRCKSVLMDYSYSPTYGILQKAKELVFITHEKEIEFKISNEL